MIIAQLLETLTMGGAENLVIRMANDLARRGHTSHILVVAGPDVLSPKIDPAVQVTYLEFERASIRNPFAFAASLLRGSRLIKQVVHQHGIQVMQTHLPGANFLGLLLALAKACPVVATVHNNKEFRYGDHDNPLLYRLRKLAYRQIVKRCQGVVAVSHEVRSSLGRDLGASPLDMERIFVVTNGVSLPEELSDDSRLQLRSAWGIAPGQILFLAAGRLCAQKNFADLIQAAGFLRDRAPEFRLMICGEGELRPELDQLVVDLDLGKNVTLPGNVTNLGELMQVADAFAMTSAWEGLPLVLLEAMASGLPAVAYGIPGVLEVIEDGHNGRIVPEMSPEPLAEAMAFLMENPEFRQQWGLAARDTVGRRFSFEATMDRIVEVYHQATQIVIS